MGQAVSKEELGGTDKTGVHTGVGVGGTELVGSVTAGTGVVSEEVGMTERTRGSDWGRSG